MYTVHARAWGQCDSHGSLRQEDTSPYPTALILTPKTRSPCSSLLYRNVQLWDLLIAVIVDQLCFSFGPPYACIQAMHGWVGVGVWGWFHTRRIIPYIGHLSKSIKNNYWLHEFISFHSVSPWKRDLFLKQNQKKPTPKRQTNTLISNHFPHKKKLINQIKYQKQFTHVEVTLFAFLETIRKCASLTLLGI